MNMIVKATDAACQWIQKNYPICQLFRLQRHVVGEAAVGIPDDARERESASPPARCCRTMC